MAEESYYKPRMYWRYVRRHRSKAKVFSLYRAIPALVVSVLQFLWLRRNRPITELLIIGGIICAVYLGLFALESLWKLFVVTPARIYGEQVDVIGELAAKSSFLEDKLRGPRITPQDQRRRESVSAKLKELSEVDRKILLHIHDHGQVKAMALKMDSKFNELAVDNFIRKAVPNGLILYQDHIMSIKPELKSAVEFVLSSEYGQDLKD